MRKPNAQTLEEFCAENDPEQDWHISPARKLVTPVFYGPQLPVAYCRDCKTQLTFSRRVFHLWPNDSTNGWRCECGGCSDEQVRSGEGESPWEALDDIAAIEWDCEPEELMR